MSSSSPGTTATRAALLVLLLGAAAAATGCAGTAEFRADPNFDPARVQRVAVLPFVDRATGDSYVSVPFAAAVDVMPILSDDRLTRENGPTVFRHQVVENIRRGTLYLIPLEIIDTTLQKQGLKVLAEYDDTNRLEVAKKLGKLLEADLVVFGEVTRWDRSYYLIASRVSAGLRLEVRSAADGQVILFGNLEDSRSAGITNIPISADAVGAALSVFGNSIKGLSNVNFGILAHDITKRILEEIRAVSVKARYGDAVLARTGPPEVRLAAHSAESPLKAGDPLIVVAVGDPFAQAAFRVGRASLPISMNEIAPGTYLGVRLILADDRFEDEKVTIRFVSPLLKASAVTIDQPRVSTAKPKAPAKGGPR